jgi:hypothetical protein
VTRFDATVGGLGGCLFAGQPGAPSNIASEELVMQRARVPDDRHGCSVTLRARDLNLRSRRLAPFNYWPVRGRTVAGFVGGRRV